MIQNESAKGTVWYGMHFYPGVAQYQEPNRDPSRVFLNEDTLRSMDPTFAGRPVFVEHVDDVSSDLKEVRKDADGWVVESFYNAADGKHWVKFMVVSEEGEQAIKSGYRLSNAYQPKTFAEGGIWNGVPFNKEITSGEYEHLALVGNPRYDESIILTPEQFKKYNEDKLVELKKLSNSQTGDQKMAFNFFKKQKVENGIDAGMSVELPKSKKEVTLSKLINDADEKEMDMNSGLADMSHKVKMHDGSYCNVGELLEKHKAMCDEMEEMKKKKEDEMELSEKDVETSAEGAKEEKGEPMKDEADKDSALKPQEEDKEMKDAKKKNAAEKAARLSNAKDLFESKEAEKMWNERADDVVDISIDKVERGKQRYGSAK